jgi:hypothetical protein
MTPEEKLKMMRERLFNEFKDSSTVTKKQTVTIPKPIIDELADKSFCEHVAKRLKEGALSVGFLRELCKALHTLEGPYTIYATRRKLLLTHKNLDSIKSVETSSMIRTVDAQRTKLKKLVSKEMFDEVAEAPKKLVTDSVNTNKEALVKKILSSQSKPHPEDWFVEDGNWF